MLRGISSNNVQSRAEAIVQDELMNKGGDDSSQAKIIKLNLTIDSLFEYEDG